MPLTDPLAKANLLVAAALELKAASRIRLAAPLDPDALPRCLPARVTEQVESGYDPATGGVMCRRRRRLGSLILSDRMEAADPAAMAEALADVVAAQDLRPLPWTDPARQLQARVALMRGLEPDDGVAGFERQGPARIDPRVAAALSGRHRAADGSGQAGPARHPARHAPLGPGRSPGSGAADAVARFPEVARPSTTPRPRRWPPRGHRHSMVWRTTPKLAGGRVPLRLALLSPAGRPIAVTADLAGFWKGAWADARRDMRGRYPRHNWPEDGGNPA